MSYSDGVKKTCGVSFDITGQLSLSATVAQFSFLHPKPKGNGNVLTDRF